MMRFLFGRSGPVWHFFIRPLILSVPFALFFCFQQGAEFSKFGEYYIATLFFSFLITFAIEANRRWVVPRILPSNYVRNGPAHPLQIASYAVAAMLGSVTAGIALHYTIAPSTFGTGREVGLLLMYSALFTVAFLGVIYAVRMKRVYVRGIRERAENLTREEQELKIAAEIQQALLPPRTRVGATYAAAGASIPCRTIGGDFFEYVDLSEDRLGFALGDVAGKGPPAAILAAMVQGIFTTNVGADAGPAATLARVNQSLYLRGIEARFATIAYMILTPDGGLISSSGGHNPALLIGGDGAVRRLDKGGLLIGAFPNAAYEEEGARLQPGDTVILYSDGVTDAENPSGEQFGEERLFATLTDGVVGKKPPEILDRILNATSTFTAGQPPADDITVLVVRFLGRP